MSEHRIVCGVCKGFGTLCNCLCKRCKGEGRINCPRCQSSGLIECPHCHGSGKGHLFLKCKYCHGMGKIDCQQCEGTGKMICPTCRGSGDAPCFASCRGRGRLPCYHCSGTGYVEKEWQWFICWCRDSLLMMVCSLKLHWIYLKDYSLYEISYWHVMLKLIPTKR